jgi:hypothetical protein
MIARPRAALVPALAAALAAAVASPPAHAYTRALSPAGIPVYWTTSCVSLTIYLNGFSMMSPDQVAKSLGAAAHTWSPDAVTCPDGLTHPYLEIVPGMAQPGAGEPAVGNDGHNVLVFRTTDWAETLYPENAIAVTSLTKKGDGRILDADVEINAQFAAWANIDPGVDVQADPNLGLPFDLQNAITHEFGHLIGLDHTCFGLADAVRQIDQNGNPVPDCNAAPADVQQTTMFANVDPTDKETSKRDLAPDDILGVCSVYPAERDPHACTLDAPDDGCGCAAARGTTGGRRDARALALALAAALALVTRGRARRAGRGPTARRG